MVQKQIAGHGILQIIQICDIHNKRELAINMSIVMLIQLFTSLGYIMVIAITGHFKHCSSSSLSD